MARKTATGEEAAAIAAAIARFEGDRIGAEGGGERQAADPWLQAALVEGVGAKQTIQDPQGGARWQS